MCKLSRSCHKSVDFFRCDPSNSYPNSSNTIQILEPFIEFFRKPLELIICRTRSVNSYSESLEPLNPVRNSLTSSTYCCCLYRLGQPMHFQCIFAALQFLTDPVSQRILHCFLQHRRRRLIPAVGLLALCLRTRWG